MLFESTIFEMNNRIERINQILFNRAQLPEPVKIPEINFIIDQNGKVLNFNADQKIHNYLLDKVIPGNNIINILPVNCGEKIVEAINNLNRSRKIDYTADINGVNHRFAVSIIHLDNGENLITIQEKSSTAQLQALEESESRFRSIWENSLDGMRLINAEGIIVAVNPSYCNLVGLKAEELIGYSFYKIYENIDTKRIKDYLQNFKRRFEERNFDTYFEGKSTLSSGKTIYLEAVNTFIESKSGFGGENTETLLLSIVRDITERKIAEEENSLLAAIVNSSDDAIIGKTIEGNIFSWNEGAEKIYGYKKEEILGRSISIIFPTDYKHEYKKIIKKVERGVNVENFKTVRLKKDGTRVDVSVTVSPIKDKKGRVVGASTIAKDITKIKKTEETQIREREELYRTITETSPDAIMLLDLKGNIEMTNRRVSEMFGHNSVEELFGENITTYTAPEYRIRLFIDFKHVIEEGLLKDVEYNFISKSGKVIPVEVSSSVVFDILGTPKSIVMVVRDISSRKLAETAIRNSELQFRSIWENSNEGMRLTDEKGTIVAVNKAFCELTGKAESELVGSFYNEVYKTAEDDLEESVEKYRIRFRNKDFSKLRHFKSIFTTDKNVELEVTYSLLEYFKGKPLLLAIFHDITERKKAEKELRESEKLAAIGKMAAYLSHEIKTPLASIKMNIEMLRKGLELDNKKERSFNIIEREVKRLDKLLKSVLQFSRQVDLVFAAINIAHVINYIKEFLEASLLQKNIRFISKVSDFEIRGDYQKLQTVLLHMIENSMDAIGSNGTIEIYAEEDAESGAKSLFIKDSGCGIKSGVKIFEPFFTEKASGTGLGLAIAQKIIEQHNGKIKLVSSVPGETIFEIIFYN